MGLHGVPQPVNALNGSVAGGVKADGILGPDASRPNSLQVDSALSCPEVSRNSSLRAVYSSVPPLLMTWLTLEVSMRVKSLEIRPFHPLRMPTPLVRTPIRFTCFPMLSILRILKEFLHFFLKEKAPKER